MLAFVGGLMDGYCVGCVWSLHSHTARVLWQFVGRDSVVGLGEEGEGAVPM